VDMEGTLTPEVWPYIADRLGISDLRLTTREVPGFEQLMSHRISILQEHDIKLPKLLEIVDEIQPLPGAKAFLDSLREKHQLIVFSDTVDQIARIFMKKLGNPTLFCNTLDVAEDGTLLSCNMRLVDGKRHGVEALRKLNFTVVAIGDAYNDAGMLAAAQLGFWVHAPGNVINDFPQFPCARGYLDLLPMIEKALTSLHA
jgi:phosphoserine/homoserine phosphotransferase